MRNSEKITITITKTHKEKGQKLSMILFGKVNLSSYIGYLIEQADNENHNTKK